MEKRVHKRHPISLSAIVRVGAFAPCACTVRDFCVGGMFLALAPEEVATLSPPGRALGRDTPLVVEVSLPEGREVRTYRLEARVARVIEQGLGIAFLNPQPEALRALERRSQQNSRARAEAARAAASGPTDGDKRRVLAAVHETVAARVGGMLVPFFRELDREMVVAANAAPSFVAQAYYFDAKAILQKSVEHVEGAFARGVMSELHALADAPAPESGPRLALSAEDLSLIEQADFEDMLATSEMATRAEERFRGLLTELQGRLAALLSLPTDISACPIGPGVFVDAFRSGVGGLGLDRQALDVVYRTFGRHVIPTLGDLYQRVNAVLAEHGVEPAPPPKPVIVRHPSSAARPPRESAGGAPPPGREAEARGAAPPAAGGYAGPYVPYYEGAAPAAGPGATLAAGPDAAATGYPSAVPGVGARPGPYTAGQPVQVAPGSMATGPAEGPGVAADDAASRPPTPIWARTVRAAQTLLGLARWSRVAGDAGQAAARGVRPGRSSGDAPMSAPPDEDEVVDALSALQREEGSLAEADGQGLRERVLAELARRRPDEPAVRLAPGQEAVFDLVEGMLRSVLDDVLLLQAVKRRVGRLSTPLHKVALLDQEFLQDPEHPARRLVDRLAQLDPETDAPDGEGPVWARVDPLLDRIAGGFDRDLGVFADAAQKVDGIVDEQRLRYRAKVDQVIRASDAQQAMLRARRGTPGVAAVRPPSPELADWVTQAKRLQVGDRVELGAGTPRAAVVDLVWIGDDHGSYVFVNRQGDKAATLSLQEVAMQLRRGSARLVAEPEGPLVDRALDGVMERVHRRLEDQARRDPATGLLNALGFEQAVGAAARDAGGRQVGHALCYVDLDRFKVLADVHGPAAADAYIAAVARTVTDALPASAVAARLAGDAFGVLLRDTPIEAARATAEGRREAVKALEVPWETGKLTLTASVGVVALTGDTPDPRDLLQAAQSACRVAKDAGYDRVRVFEPKDEGMRRRQELRESITRLTEALDGGRFALRCQPIVPIGGEPGRLPHIEVLLGLTNPDGSPVSPAEIVAAAEHYQQAVALDRLVIRETLRWMSERPMSLARLGGCAINLSAQSLSDEGLAGYVVDQLMQTRVPPGKVVFEVTETAAVVGLSAAQQFMRTLRDLGCRFSLDDFGSGHTSFAYLKTLPAEFVKIDGMFVLGLEANPHDYAVVKSINEIAHVMGKQTIAEHVETPEVLELLKTIGVDYVQGYLLGKPQPLGLPETLDQTTPLSAATGALAVAPEETTVRLWG